MYSQSCFRFCFDRLIDTYCVRRCHRIVRVAVSLLMVSVVTPAVRADFQPPVVIRNVRLVQADRDDARVSIVMQEGRFVGVGADAAAPAGAQELDGTGLIAYPGFIDALTQRGAPVSESADDRARREDEPQDPVSGPLPRMSEAYRRRVHPSWRM